MTTFLYSSQDKFASFLKRRRHVGGSSGFSLIEVTLALGIVAFSVITLVGLIPMGLTTFHKAVATSVSSQIVQQVVTDVQQTDFNQLLASNTQPLRYFDDQGNELSSATAPGVVYNVNVVVNTPVGLTGGNSSNLACLNIEIVSNPGHAALQKDAAQSIVQDTTHGIYVSRYSAFVAKNQ
jgi:uncharacterized protein (TIGR02598 family)